MSEDTNYYKSVHTIGRITLIGAFGLSFLPMLYLLAFYEVNVPVDAAVVALIGIWSAYAITYFVEPIAFFAPLGTAGTYISFLAGNIGLMRIPAARVAKDIAGTEDGTKEAELVAICALAGSVFLNIAFVTIAVIAGVYILNVLPDLIVNSISSYVVPSIFGAVFAMFARNRLKIAAPAFAFAMLIYALSNFGVTPVLLGRFNMIFSIAFSIILAKIMYDKKMLK
ncbi:MAG: hypothetical protein FWG64_10435 [Firmicutes bacterium]|nr:hypothetical protein [Bacillota bacterium]